MWDMVLLRMEGLIFNVLAMDSGLHVNRDVAFGQKAEQEAKLLELTDSFKAFRQHIPEYVEFKDTSDFHMSAWLFGGPVKYRIRDTWFEDDGVTPKFEKIDCYKFGDTFVPVAMENGENMDGESFERCVAAYGAADKYKAGKQRGQIKVHAVPGQTPKQKWYDSLVELQGVIDLSKR